MVRGRWHADYVYGSGSAILLRYEGRFFLLTAKHVLSNNTPEAYQNESPFFTTIGSRAGWSDVTDVLYPARLWDIGALIQPSGVSIDVQDVVLIELFPPLVHRMPDHFIDLDGNGRRRVLPREGFFHGQLLFASGFPHWKNSFQHEPIGEFTHHTSISRLITPGVCRFDGGEPTISFEMTEGEHAHENLNGMSGGVVFNLRAKMNNLDWCGITVSGGNDILRFIPAYLVLPAILRFRDAPSHVIDPAAELDVRTLLGQGGG